MQKIVLKVKVNESMRKKAFGHTGDLICGKVYEVQNIEGKGNFYRIIDESGEDYMYPPMLFEIIEDEEK